MREGDLLKGCHALGQVVIPKVGQSCQRLLVLAHLRDRL
jgi:hypothetical protein